MTDSSDLTQTN